MRGLQVRFVSAVLLGLGVFQVFSLSGDSSYIVAAKVAATAVFLLLWGYGMFTWFLAVGVSRKLKRLRRSPS